jgi:GntR family transcriptional regulator/MocR family aminotransferase
MVEEGGKITRAITGYFDQTTCRLGPAREDVKQPAEVPPWIDLDKASQTPLHRQLYDALRGAILDGRLVAGARLPSTRTLARELGVSRSTVVEAFRQLLAEGYIKSTVGSGTRVSAELPEEALRARTSARLARDDTGRTRLARKEKVLSRRGRLLTSAKATTSPDLGKPRVFRPGLPALDEFPSRTWSRITADIARHRPSTLLAYGPSAGYGPLRQAVAEYLAVSRGVRCEPEQVVVVSGSQQALYLAASILLDPGDEVWVEDPGYAGVRGALVGAGAKLVPVPVDEEGLDVDAGISAASRARMAYVTPSHQYPTGSVMCLARRLKLLDWAVEADAWLLEDDYDSEYRYSGRPLSSLQGLDEGGRVIYVGTFSKVLAPALRLGYLVAPPDLVDGFISARALSDRHPPTLEQAVLAEFIVEGHFARHLRRTRTLYATRQRALIEAAEKELTGVLEFRPARAGMHLVGWLSEGSDDRYVSRLAAAAGVEAPPLSAYSLGAQGKCGLVLGYAAFTEREISGGVAMLGEALR